jgi:hypothetical protein
MAAGPQLPEGVAYGFDYWLRRCEGFRVDSPQGRVGFVEEVRYASRLDRPDLIAVRAGLLGRLLLIVPVGEIAEILASEERIVLHRSPRPTATERVQDLLGQVQAGTGRGFANSEVECVGAGFERIEAEKEVESVIRRLAHRVGLRLGRGGERKMTPDVEASAESSAEQPSAEEQAGEQAAAEAPAAETAEAMPAEEPAPEEPAAEEARAEPAGEAVPAQEAAPEELPAEEQTGEGQATA